MTRRPRRKPRKLKVRYYVAIGRGERVRCMALRPWALYALVICAPLLLAAAGALGVASLAYPGGGRQAMAARQAEMRADFQDRLALMRAKIDQLADKRAREQQTLETQVSALARRQARLASRANAIASLARISGSTTQIISAASPIKRAGARAAPVISPFLNPARDSTPSRPATTQAFAPSPVKNTGSLNVLGSSQNKPRPDGVELRSDREKTSALIPNPTVDPALPIATRLAVMNADVSRVETKQLDAVARIASSIERKARRIRLAITETGLSLRHVASRPPSHGEKAAMGGPFVPVNFEPDASPFQSRLERLQGEIASGERLIRALPYLPFRQPLKGRLVTTSPFGMRVDPFLGRLAMHTGNDFRAAYGSKVIATAAGKVVRASFDGGYGNMVEIDHGGGLATLYAHLSAITVVKGQQVEAGTQLGRVGSTGRSTGPHLHYEVRIDGHPVDPIPFVKAGERLFASR